MAYLTHCGMSRQPRFIVPGQPQHIIQRGNNRTPIFDSPSDHLYFRECLLASVARFGCEIHAYVFMHNHVHLLMSSCSAHGISKVMQCVGRRYVRYFNHRHQRTGTLWEGRYRASVIDSERYLFTCSRYIEENPVRAGVVMEPSQYPWSSYHANALGSGDALVTPHDLYTALGSTASSREHAYRAMFSTNLDTSTITMIRDATNQAWALGDDRFRKAVGRVGRRAAPLLPGRPLL